MINWNKRFKNIHSFETQANALQFKVENGEIRIPDVIHCCFRIYGKDLYLSIESNSNFKIQNLFETVKKEDFWVYVLLDPDFGVSFKKTYVDPFVNLFGDDFPQSPNPGELFFNRNISRMFVWNGIKWIEHDAIVLGKFDESGNCIAFYHRQSQGGYKSGAYLAKAVQFVRETPVRIFESSGYSFMTKDEAESLTFSVIDNLRLDTLLHRTRSSVDLPKFTAVIRKDDGFITNADLQSDEEAVAVTLQECNENEECIIIERGFVYDRSKQWPQGHNTRIYYDNNGKLTTIAPSLNSSYAVQEIGHVSDIYTIYIQPREKMILYPP